MLFAFEHGQNGDIFVQKAPACTIQTQAEAVCELFGGRKENIKVIGIRHGEKMYETLLTNEECAKAEDMGDFYRVPADNRGLNYDKFFKEGEHERATLSEFNSNNTRILNVEETKTKIEALGTSRKNSQVKVTLFNKYMKLNKGLYKSLLDQAKKIHACVKLWIYVPLLTIKASEFSMP